MNAHTESETDELRIPPMDLGDIFDHAIGLTLRYFKPLLCIVLILYLPLRIVTGILFAIAPDPFFVFVMPPDEWDNIGVSYQAALFMFPLALLLTGVLTIFVWPVGYAAAARCIAGAYVGAPIDWREALARSLGQWLPLAGAAFLVTVGVGVGTMLCIIPGVLLAIVWALVMPVIACENLGPINALKRSYALTEGVRLRILALVIVSAAAGLGVQAIGAIALPMPFLYPVVEAVLESLLAIFGAALWTVFYLSARARREHLDLELLVNRAARAAEGDTPVL